MHAGTPTKSILYVDSSQFKEINIQKQNCRGTREFFKKAGPEAEIYVSSLVKDEVSAIDNVKRKKEINALCSKYESLIITDKARELAEYYINNGLIPKSHIEDALHLAIEY